MTIHLNKYHLGAIILFLIAVGWVAFGTVTKEVSYETPRSLVLASGLQRVQVERMTGKNTAHDIVISGKSAANREVTVRSEISSKVIKVLKQKGDTVRKGDVIVQLDERDAPAKVKQARASLEQAKLNANSVESLHKKDLANASDLAKAKTALANAEAALIRAQLHVKSTRIQAPFDGVLDQVFVELGDYVKNNSPMIKVLDFKPLLIKGQLTETDVPFVSIGAPAFAELTNGVRIDGRIRFISAAADSSSRTFDVEMEATQDNGFLSSGITAKLHIPKPDTKAYFVSPALLILDDQGRLGLKGIDNDNRVIFYPISLLRAETRGLWIYGLGDQANIITAGQGFVDYGEEVEPVFKNNAPQASAE